MNRFRLALAFLLSLIAGDALAQGSPTLCARAPTYVGCYPASTSFPRTAMVPLALGDTQRTVSVGSLLSKMLASDVTAALGFTPQSAASAIVSGAVDASGNLILKRADGTTLPPIGGFTAGGGTGGTGGTGSTTSLLSALSSAGIVIPHLQFAIDASLPATVGSTPAMGFNVDSAGKIDAYADPKGTVFTHYSGKSQLVAGGAGGYPVIRNVANTDANITYDTMVLPPSALASGGIADQMFGQVGEAYYCAAVLKPLGGGGQQYFRVYSSVANIVLIPSTAGDGTWRIEQNNGAAIGTEPPNSTLIGRAQIVEWGADGGINYIFRNGVATMVTPSDPSHIGGLTAGTITNFQLINDSRTDTSAVVCASGFPSRSLRGTLISAMASRYGITGTTSPTDGPTTAVEPLAVSTPVVTTPTDNSRYAQSYIQPTVIPTSSAVPVGVTLTNPNSNIFDATFAAGGTAGTNAQLDKMFYFTNNEGGFATDAISTPATGAAGNWESRYEHNPAFLADGVTPDPANLHDLTSGDHLSCIARTRMAVDANPARWVQCYLRATVSMKPGRYAELRARWPSPKREGISARYAWPVFWGFSVYQPFGTTNVINPQPSREIDVFDGYPGDNRRPGESISSGNPLMAYTGDSGPYAGSTDQSGAPGYALREMYGEPDGIGRVYPDYGTAYDPTEDYHTYGWYLAPNGADLYFLIDGKIVRHRYVPHLAVDTNGNPIEYRIEVSNQYGTKFNNADHAALVANDDTANPLRSSYDLKYLRVWDSPVTLPAYVPYTAPALPGANAAVVSGATFNFRNTASADQHIDGAGTLVSPLRMAGPSAGNNDVRTFLGTSWNQLGTRTIRMRPEIPHQDSFQAAFAVWKDGTTGYQNAGIVNVYQAGYDGYTAVLGHKDDGSDNYYIRPGTSDGVGNYSELGNYLPFYARVVGDSTNYTFAASRTGAAGTWNVLGVVPKADMQGGTPDQVGVYLRSQDVQGYSRPVWIELSGFAANDNSTDIQAAAGF